MTHVILADVLDPAQNFSERVDGVREAIQLQIPLVEIEEYLDCLDYVRSARQIKDD